MTINIKNCRFWHILKRRFSGSCDINFLRALAVLHLNMYLIKTYLYQLVNKKMEEREGFEPSRRSHAWQFSRLLPSTTRPPLLKEIKRFTVSIIF